jgi:hypothetical protein
MMVVILDAEVDEGEELLTITGALAKLRTCIMLGSLKWEISASIPKRLISLRTTWGEMRQNEFYANFFPLSLF